MTPDPSTTDSAAATAATLLLRSSLIHALDRTLLQQQPTLAAVRDAWRNGTTVVAAFLATSPRLASPMVLSIGCGTRAVGHRANQHPLPTNQRKEASYGVEGEEDEATREWSARRVWCCDDLHAEVLARRGLRAALCAHVTALLSVPSPAQQPPQPSRLAQESPFVAIDHEVQRDGEERTRLTVRWRDDFSLHLLINEVPCGAMSVLSSEAEERCHQQHEQRGEEDSVPAAGSDVLGRTTTGAHPLLRTPFRSIDLLHEAEVLKVNAGAWGHQLGVLHCPVTHRLPNISRTKPGKGIPSLCMSCSDKILRWQVEGLLGSTFPSFSSPKVLRLASLCVVLPSSTSSCVVRCLQEVAEAGLNGRLQALLDTTATMPPPPPPPPSSCFSDSPSLPSSSSTFARVDVCVTTREEEDVVMPDAETVTTKGAQDGSFTCVAWGGPSIGLRKEPDVHQASSSNNTTTTTTEGWQLYRLNPKSGGPFSMTESALQRHIASVSAFASASPASSLQTLVQQQQGRRETTGGSEHGSEASRKRQRCNEELHPCSTPPHLLRREGLLCSSSVPSSSSYVASVPLSASSKQLMMNPITRWGWRQSATHLADLLSRCDCLRLLVGRREMPLDDDFLLPSSKSSNGGMEVEEEQEKDHVLQHHYDEWKRHVVRQQQWHQQQQQQQQRLMSAAPDREANLMMMIGWEWKEFLRDCRVPMMLWVEKPKKNTRSRVAKSK